MFYLISLTTLVAGLLAVKSPKYSVLMFGVLLSVVPTGNSYSELISAYGIFFFDFYVAGAGLALVIRQVLTGRPQFTLPPSLLFGMGIYVLLLALGLFSHADKFLLKDTRPLILILSFVVLNAVARQAADRISLRVMLSLLILMTSFNLFDLAWLRLGMYHFQDAFYEDNSYRYLDGGTYAAVAFLIYYVIDPQLFRREKRLAQLCLLSSILCMFIANSRFMFLGTFAALVLHQYAKPGRLILLLVAGVIGVFAFIQISNMIGADRISASMTSDGFNSQVISRFSPALELIQTMNPLHYFVGLGAGTPFEIPWFDYRGLDDLNANIDSAYLTYFVKYGLLGLFLLWLFTKSIVRTYRTKVGMSISVFLGVMFVVSATPYQPYAVGLGYAAIMLRLCALHHRPAHARQASTRPNAAFSPAQQV